MVSEENATSGSSVEFMRLSGSSVGVAHTSKNVKVIVCGMPKVESKCWGIEMKNFCGKYVMEVGGGVKDLDPKGWW